MQTRVLNLPPVPHVNSLGYGNPQISAENQRYRERFQQEVARYEQSLKQARVQKEGVQH
ncbi:hypothetical protein QWY31_04070 [Cytophagales bacterium LB-30]|uniref:Uncharacterized protein n=1 Tax=Shiella aurantiaca TaxID=3058365 RepID=A0ABT8F2Q6_9BACT|nr:hypothetical protein [Shiella aurantiaca]MDN4164663.1 hypothetical protein [Shiella aurantiaca]